MEIFWNLYWAVTNQEPRRWNYPHIETANVRFYWKNVSAIARRTIADKRRELGGFYSITKSGCPFIGRKGERWVYFASTRSFKMFRV